MSVPPGDEFYGEGLGEPKDRTHVRVTAPATWPAAAAATMITLFVIAGTVLMCLGCLGVFGGRFGK